MVTAMNGNGHPGETLLALDQAKSFQVFEAQTLKLAVGDQVGLNGIEQEPVIVDLHSGARKSRKPTKEINMTPEEEQEVRDAATKLAAQVARETNQAAAYERRLREIVQEQFPNQTPTQAAALEEQIQKATAEYKHKSASEVARTAAQIERSQQDQRDQQQRQDRGLER